LAGDIFLPPPLRTHQTADIFANNLQIKQTTVMIAPLSFDVVFLI